VERERVTGAGECDLPDRWGLSFELSNRLVASAHDYERETALPVWIISGYRTEKEQDALRRRGRPTADENKSTHRSCPATGADVALGFAPTRVQKAIWGRIVVMNGLRWGGGGAVDSGGIPVDWGHIDLGPRNS